MRYPSDMKRLAIRLAEDGHSLDVELLGGINDPAGNLTAVGNQDLVKEGLLLVLVLVELLQRGIRGGVEHGCGGERRTGCLGGLQQGATEGQHGFFL